MIQTYHPLLESVPLRRFRLSALPGPDIGTVLVLERSVGDPVVVEAGARVPEAHTGNYRVLHRVDVANRAVRFTMSSPSSDPAFTFTVVISCACRVTDPVAVVRDDVRDMAAAVQAWFTGAIRAATAGHDALRPNDAEADVAASLAGARMPAGVRLSGFTVEVHTRDTAEIMTTKQELRVQQMYRDAMRPVAKGGRDEMLAHVMGMSGGDPTTLLDREQRAREAHTQASLNALGALMNSDKVEEHNASLISETAMNQFFGEPLLGGRSRGVRERVERRRRSIDGRMIGDPAEAVEPADGRSGRVRGLSRPEDG